jgi:hypothetical protein
MAALESNPFAILTFIAAPAVLTNASSVLVLGTTNRFGRNVDRARELITLLEGRDPNTDEEAGLYRQLLQLLEGRMKLLVRAMSLFYFSIGCFAAGSLTSLLGAIVATTEHQLAFRISLTVAMITGAAGLLGLFAGGWLLVRETQLALRTIIAETTYYKGRYHYHGPTPHAPSTRPPSHA